jgi:hypothetical protein
MSAVTVNCFGLVDPTGTLSVNMQNLREYRHLHKAYVYNESVAGCGGNNVASLLIKDLHNSGLMDRTKGPGGHLVAALDNCPGQNKNNHVLKTLCAWLVEKEYCLKVTVVFLMKGHTKAEPAQLTISSTPSKGNIESKTLKPWMLLFSDLE